MFQAPRSLVDAVRSRSLVPFVGAGISVSAVSRLAPERRFPDWKALIGRLATRLEVEGRTADAAKVLGQIPIDIMAAAQLAADGLGRLIFIEEMRKAFESRQRPPGADLTAVNAIWRLGSPFVITTNYDMVLAWPGQVTQVHNDDPSLIAMLDRSAQGERQVWHLHGSIDRPDTMILTSAEYEKLYPVGTKRTEYQNAFNHFQHLLTQRSFLFLGFSLAEPVLRKKLEDVMALTAKATPLKYLLLVAGEADDAAQQEFFEKYNVQVIEFERFGDPMVAAIDAIGREARPEADQRVAIGGEMRPLVEDLLGRLGQLVLRPDTVARLYNASRPDGWERALKGGDGIALLHDAVSVLGASVIPPNGAWPLLAFADRLKNEATEPWLTRITAWIGSAVDRLGADEAARDAIRHMLAAAREASVPRSMHVLVRIAPHAALPGQWLVHAWSWSGDVPEAIFGPEGRSFEQAAPDTLVLALFEELEARDSDPETTSISFLVGHELVCEPVDLWKLPAGVGSNPPIGATYMVNVRSLDRLEKPALIRRRLRKAWDALKQRAATVFTVFDPAAPLASANVVHAVWVDRQTAMRRDLGVTLQQQGALCALIRTAPGDAMADQLRLLLDTTTPVVLWYRDPAANPVEAETAIQTLIESAPISDLPRRIRQERLAAFYSGSPAHPGVNLGFMWENADYIPPEQEAFARARLERS